MRVGWINGEWDFLENIHIPINDRGLSYGDGIFETILIKNGKPLLLKEHLTRLKKSSLQLGLTSPPSYDEISSLISEGVNKYNLRTNYYVIRINWSRGASVNRGINYVESDQQEHRLWIELNSANPNFEAITAKISTLEKRNEKSQLFLHKTFSYGQSIQALREAKSAGFDEALFENNIGEICCSTTSNILVKRNNIFLTPPIKSGCLPGIMRQKGIDSGIFLEEIISNIPFKSDQWILINSLNCKPIQKVNEYYLDVFKDCQKLWEFLYQC